MTNEVAEYSAAIPFLVQTAQRRVNRLLGERFATAIHIECGRVHRAPRSFAVRFESRRDVSPRVFWFRTRGQTDDWRIRLSQPATPPPALDMPEVSAFLGILDLTYFERKEHRGEPPSQFRCSQKERTSWFPRSSAVRYSFLPGNGTPPDAERAHCNFEGAPFTRALKTFHADRWGTSPRHARTPPKCWKTKFSSRKVCQCPCD